MAELLKHMEKRIWITFDLGVRGDYDRLYQWLDSHEAVECGNGVATLSYKFNTQEETFEGIFDEIRKDLQNAITIDAKTKIYVLVGLNNDNGSTGGGFIFGSRRSAPWDGYAQKDSKIDE